jgi:hypothetical protein
VIVTMPPWKPARFTEMRRACAFVLGRVRLLAFPTTVLRESLVELAYGDSVSASPKQACSCRRQKNFADTLAFVLLIRAHWRYDGKGCHSPRTQGVTGLCVRVWMCKNVDVWCIDDG